MISVLKLIRRRVTFWGVLAVLLIFILFTYSHQQSKNDVSSGSEDRVVRKRLQTIDNIIEPVQFIPGIPGHSNRIVNVKEAPNNDGFYAQRNKLFQVEKDKHSANKPAKFISNNIDSEVISSQLDHLQGREHFIPQVQGAIDNVEYDNNYYKHQDGNLGRMSADLGAPIYYNQQNGQSWNGQSNYIQQNQGLISGGGLYNNGGGGFQQSSAGDKPYVPQQRLVHFDFKGATPRVSYLKKILPILKDAGATGVLWEWEDSFPFTGRLEVAAVVNHYTQQDVLELLELCKDLGLESIPLVQTFGHMEFILKLKQFSFLRDNSEFPESICPCHNDTMPLLREYIKQVMALHKDAKYLHIGCDEVYHLGTCEQCNDQPRNKIFTDHVTRLGKHVSSIYKVKPIIWHDMLVNFMEDEMMPLANLVEPMVWIYAEDVYRFMPSFNWDRLSAVFPYVWTASAYKGAHGETLVVPDAKRHMVNQLNWLEVMRQEESKFTGGFKGIVLTGWQRFDHFAVLCELLASGFPNLVLDMIAVTHGYYNTTIFPKFFSALSCPNRGNQQTINLETDRFLWSTLSWCNFPGSAFFRVTEQLVTLEKEVASFIKMAEKQKGWFTQFNKDHHLGSSFRIDQIFEDWSRHQHETTTLMKKAGNALKEVYDHHTQGEWVEEKLYPIYKKLSKMRQEADELKRDRTWLPRPFPIPQTLRDMGIGVPPSTTTLPPDPLPTDKRGKRRVQNPDLYSSRGRLKNLGHR